ncbi:50S ribosomal protein L9 [Persicirhabdus sediminis]|uniref:Large ribosomal subunit protein bL9 n=1 Tax=Persicirhabdus sediminis TaxID=454144 RepID=A0A8J7MFQ0_9BACT|nr:50S ribosomal protein L9 [Persicirhabdus sediminis]MBK1792621.1 50S ribosomal protein L9 [Persicirhabdus sediminis]
MATTEVILREKIENLGAEADVVKVKAGFARNFLIPQGKAFEATRGNLRHLEALKAARAEREAAERAEAQEVANKLNKTKLSFTLETGQGGKAFGSVTSIDIHKKLEEKGIEIDRHAIVLDKAIKNTGKFDVEVKVYTDLLATLKVTVKAAEEEVA